MNNKVKRDDWLANYQAERGTEVTSPTLVWVFDIFLKLGACKSNDAGVWGSQSNWEVAHGKIVATVELFNIFAQKLIKTGRDTVSIFKKPSAGSHKMVKNDQNREFREFSGSGSWVNFGPKTTTVSPKFFGTKTRPVSDFLTQNLGQFFRDLQFLFKK